MLYRGHGDPRGRNLDKITRRSFVTAIGVATVIPAFALRLRAAPERFVAAPSRLVDTALAASPEPPRYRFFSAAEAQFIEAACERLIPANASGPGALGAGVPKYVDSQLCGAWGSGERLYRSGPWQPGTPPQGYLAPFTPAELFHTALRAIDRSLEARGTAFQELSAEAQDAYLKFLEAGSADLDGVPSAVFFDLLLKMTVEGFFSDPVHGGRRGLVTWRVIGFPGAYAARNRLARSQSQR